MKFYTREWAIVKKNIDAADPMGLFPCGCPEDEYDPEIERTVAGLGNCKTENDIRDLLHRVFAEMFEFHDVGTPEQYQKPASEIYRE